MTFNDRRTTIFCLLAITIAWVLFCWPWFWGGKIIPYDAKNHFYPMIRFVADAWHSGESFTWSPHHYGGFPMIADPQSAIWTPTFWIPSLISPNPSMQLVDFVHLIHLLFGAFAIFGFGRISGWRWEASVVAALIYMMAGPSSLRLEHMLMTVSYMWLAITLWRLKAVMEYGGIWRGLTFGIALALVLIDRNHVAYMGTWFLFIYWIAAVVRDVSQRKSDVVRRSHIPVAIGGVFALIVIAVPVILLLQLANDSNRPEFSYLEASWQSLHPVALFSFILPEYFGSLRLGGGQHWGPPSNIWGEKGLQIHRGMLHMYSGAVPLLLIVWFGIIKRQLFIKEARFFAIACIICVIYALGRYTPVFYVFYKFIPGIDLFRRPADALFIFGFSLSLLSGALIQQGLFLQRDIPSRVLHILTAVGLTILFVGMFWLANSYERLPDFVNSLIVPLVIIATSLLTIYIAQRSGRSRHAMMMVLAGVVAADLIYHSSNTRINARSAGAYQVLQDPQDHPIFSKMLTLLPRTDALGVNWRTEIIGLGPVVQNLPQVIQSQGLLGYNPLRLSGFEQHIAPNMQNNASTKRRFGDKMTSYNSDMANQLGLRYIISGAPLNEIDTSLGGDHLTLLGTAKHKWRTAYFYENTKALPRAVVQAEEGQKIDREISSVKYRNAEIEIIVGAGDAGMFVLREFYYPGWQATVNGKPVKISKHEGLFRSIPLSTQESHIIFRFEPLTLANIWSAIKVLVN
ncbi:hypothetical protein F9L33_07100 [Amylibacter sp. SFDW26]|uniref:hypothetical protein n=1 Tax=Amylibacter sp. SFDW26 TaxID=2652722 RepID=UPI001261A4A6|nr:hypothetical protein [Amylibacter sp. SFDW26]KAB7614405.1 hypothetical protein F9L33_07100 [Amylibacter sp. SFDW26]